MVCILSESNINEILPTELIKKILENLDFKSLKSARQCCKQWKEIIDVFELALKRPGEYID